MSHLTKKRYIAVLLFTLPFLIHTWRSAALAGSKVSRENDVVKVVRNVGPAVVTLSTERLMAQRRRDPFFGFRNELFNRFFNDYFGNFDQKKVATPLGSGVIIDEMGYIVTNEHVITRASVINVMLADETEFSATLISADPVNDLAILKIDSPKPLPFIEMGISDDLMQGETVIAMGNPFGLGTSVTTGVLSALHRTLNFGDGNINIEYKDLLQTDALINPGNSGGPLVNINGKLIGINTAVLSEGQGIGFAIPVNKVKHILVKLLDFRYIKNIWLGIKVVNSSSVHGGVEITEVEGDSPARLAGLEKGDVISRIDGKLLGNVIDYEKYVLKKDADDSIMLTIYRDLIKMEIPVVLEKTPTPSATKLALSKIGVYVQELTESIAGRLGIRRSAQGVLISGVEKDSPADAVQILAGYVIVRIGQYRITNLQELGAVLDSVRSEEIVDIGLIWADAYGEHRGYAKVEAR